ncbi:MAG: helix-turn-helix domain-containing protein [Limnochordia bacterium]
MDTKKSEFDWKNVKPCLDNSNPSFQQREEEALKKYRLILPILEGQASIAEYCQKENLSRTTIYRYLKKFKAQGLRGLLRKQRADAGRSRTLTEEQIELLLAAKHENYKRSAEVLSKILQFNGVRRPPHLSSIQRVLRQHNMGRGYRQVKPKVLLPMDIRGPMEVWMGDFSPGIYLPHPQSPNKKARTHLCLWLDAGGDMVVGGSYYWQANQFNGLCTLKDALIRFGLPLKLYIDNGELAGGQVERVAAYLKIMFIRGTPYHKEGRAHVERMFRTVQEAFESELRVYPVTTLAELNRLFGAWLERFWFERKVKGGMSILQHYLTHMPVVRSLSRDDYSLFLFEEKRRIKSNCLVSVAGVSFWASPALAGKMVSVRFNPNSLDYIEIWLNGRKYETAYPFNPDSVAYRLCRQMSYQQRTQEPTEPVCNFLQELADGYQLPAQPDADLFIIVLEKVLARALDLVQLNLARQFWQDNGPFDLSEVEAKLKTFVDRKGHGLHIHYYLQALVKLPRGNQSAWLPRGKEGENSD